MSYSSSTLKIFNNNCPAALGFYEDQTPYDRDIFQAGVAAHAIAQVICEKGATDPDDMDTVAQAVIVELTTLGRSFKGLHEPPMSCEHAMLGRDIALEYFYLYPPVYEPGALFETALAMNPKGEACAVDHETARYDAIMDVIYFDTEGTEDFQVEVAVVRDYKSAWPTDASELDTLQVKGHAVLAWQHYGDRVGGVRNEIVNLRTKQVHTRTTYFNDEGFLLLNQWRDDILTACHAADVTREARPGAGCIGCKYTLACGDCITAYSSTCVEETPVRFAAAKALVGELGKIMRADAKVSPVAVPGGEIAYRGTNEKIPTDGAIDALLDHWFPTASETAAITMGELQGLLIALDVKASSYEKAAKTLYQDKNNSGYIDMLNECITTKMKSRFDVYKK